MTNNLDAHVRRLIAEAVGLAPADIARLPASTDLFAPEIGLSSLAGLRLLTAVQREFGIDIAAEDLNLDALESIEQFTNFIAARQNS